MGLVTQIFRERDFYPLVGDMAIGHTRYSTSGSSELCNAQPLLVESQYGQLAVANNGNIINALQLKNQLQDEWSCTFNSTTDTEVGAQLLAHSTGATWKNVFFNACVNWKGLTRLSSRPKTR